MDTYSFELPFKNAKIKPVIHALIIQIPLKYLAKRLFLYEYLAYNVEYLALSETLEFNSLGFFIKIVKILTQNPPQNNAVAIANTKDMSW